MLRTHSQVQLCTTKKYHQKKPHKQKIFQQPSVYQTSVFFYHCCTSHDCLVVLSRFSFPKRRISLSSHWSQYFYILHYDIFCLSLRILFTSPFSVSFAQRSVKHMPCCLYCNTEFILGIQFLQRSRWTFFQLFLWICCSPSTKHNDLC